MTSIYIHGYSLKESNRLYEQASILRELLHRDTFYPEGSNILEVGCGVGAQSITLAKNNPKAKITAIDISSSSIKEAKRLIKRKGITNISFHQGDILDLPFQAASFDHIFGSFILEHFSEPLNVLTNIKKLLKPSGTIRFIEGDHGSAHFYPNSDYAKKVIQSQIDVQKMTGGNANIGRELYPLLITAGFTSINITPLPIYNNSNSLQFNDDFVRKIYIPMIQDIRHLAIETGMIDPETFDRGIEDLYKAASPSGTFFFTFYTVVANLQQFPTQ